MVHGDYFSANLLPKPEGICVLDCETFAWGDPMPYLGFLIGTDLGQLVNELASTVAAYSAFPLLHRHQLQ